MKVRIVFAATVALFLCGVVLAQTPGFDDGYPSLRYGHVGRNGTSAWPVEYVSIGGEPALRLKVHHYHGWCNGYLYFTSARIIYIPSLTPWTKDGFSVNRSDVSRVALRDSGISIGWASIQNSFAFLSYGYAGTGQDERQALMQFVQLASTNFDAARQVFLTAIARLRAGAPGAPTFSAQPVISILEPSGASANATVAASAQSLQIVGIATASSGIRGVTVDNQPAKTTQLSPQIVEFESQPALLTPGTSLATVSAQAVDNSQAQLAFNVIRPEIRVSDPAEGYASPNEVVSVRGTVFGMRDVRRIDVGGVNAALTRRSDGGIDFDASKVPLQLGPNLIPAIVERGNGRDTTFTVSARRLPPGPPAMSLPYILQGLSYQVPQEKMIRAVQEKGVDFPLTPEVESRLREAGAKDPLIQAIAKGRR